MLVSSAKTGSTCWGRRGLVSMSISCVMPTTMKVCAGSVSALYRIEEEGVNALRYGIQHVSSTVNDPISSKAQIIKIGCWARKLIISIFGYISIK